MKYVRAPAVLLTVAFGAFGAFGALGCAAGCKKTRAKTFTGVVEDPQPKAGHRIRSITAGAYHDCALYADGTAACWGSGAEAALGRKLPPGTAAKIDGLTGAERLSVGQCNACALAASGQLVCWGYRGAYCAREGELVYPRPTPIKGVKFHNIPAATFLDSMLAVDDSGSVRVVASECRAPLHEGADCVAANVIEHELAPAKTGIYESGVLDRAVEITTASSSCIREWDGHVRCWNDSVTNGRGEHFVALEAPSEPASSISGFFNETGFVLRSGKVECRSTDGIVTPTLPGPARSVACGYGGGCAAGVDGALTCWKHGIVPQDDRKNPERPPATLTIQNAAAHVRLVIHDLDTYCTLDDADVVMCGVETAKPERIVLP